MSSQHLQKILQGLGSIKPFPQSATRVLGLAGQPDVVPSQLTQVIRSDPGLTAKVLKICNSAIYGFQREIGSIDDAGNLLGLRTLTGIVMTSAAGDWVDEDGKSTGPGTLERCLSNAIASKALAQRSGKLDPETAYVGGLLQDVGALVLKRYCASTDVLVRQAAQDQPWVEAEMATLGVHHAEIGGRLLTKWSLPEELVAVARHHHDPLSAGEHVIPATLGCVAEHLTATRFRSLGHDWPESAVTAEDLERLGLTGSDLLHVHEVLEERLRDESLDQAA